MNAQNRPPKLSIRSADTGDIDDIIALQVRAYRGLEPDTPGMLRGRLARFPEGQIVIEMDGKLAGYSMRWTLSLLFAGLVIGGFNVYWLIRSQD